MTRLAVINNAPIGLGPVNIATIVVYMVVAIAMGFWFSRRERTSEDFLLGGRRIPWWAIGISCLMSLTSTISMVMVPGEVFNNGLSTYILFSFVYPFTAIGAFFLFIRFYYKLKVFTPFAYLERRYDTGVRHLISILYFWTRLVYLAMVLFSSAKVFTGAAGWNPYWTIPIIAVIGILYTVLGGMRAVVWTDVLQFFVLYGGLTLAIVICTSHIDGGFAGVFEYAFEHNRGPVQYANPEFYQFHPYVRLCFWMLLLMVIFDPIFYNGCDQITVQRLLSTRSYKDSMKAAIANSMMVLPSILMLQFIGLAIFAYYGQNPDPSLGAKDGDKALFNFIGTMMPAPLPGLMLAAMLAAAMSTLDSGMNSLSAVAVKDFYLKFGNPNASERKQVLLARILTVAIGIFAALVALAITRTSDKLEESVMEAAVIWGALGAILGPVFLLAVTTRRVTGRVIWIGTALAWGVNSGMVTWYIASKNGLDGAISESWIVVPLCVTALTIGAAVVLWALAPRRTFGLIVPVVLGLGYSSSMILWFVSGRMHGGELSFMWVTWPGLLAFLAVGYGSLLFLNEPDERTHRGLTLFSAAEPIDADAP